MLWKSSLLEAPARRGPGVRIDFAIPGAKVRLACVSTHPIQYHAEWFRALAAHPQVSLEVMYCHKATPRQQAEAGFGVEFDWDVPLLDGYSHRFLRNISSDPGAGSFDGLDTPELSGLISGGHFDAILVNGWHYKSAWQAIRACWKSGVPVLVRSDSHMHTERHPLKKLAKEIPYRWFIRKLDACLAVGRWSKEYFQHYGAQPERIFLVPHTTKAVRDAEFWLLQSRRTEFRARWGIRPWETVFAFSGKFVETKRPLDFVRGLALAHGQRATVVGLMAGDGPLRERCQRMSANANLPIHFTGFLNQSEIEQAYVAADALVLPSNGETWGMVVNEAMTWSRPCLVSDKVGCGPDLIEPGETGAIFPLGDVDKLSLEMISCALQPDRLARMGKNARAKIAGYSAQASADGVVQALNYVRASR